MANNHFPDTKTRIHKYKDTNTKIHKYKYTKINFHYPDRMSMRSLLAFGDVHICHLVGDIFPQHSNQSLSEGKKWDDSGGGTFDKNYSSDSGGGRGSDAFLGDQMSVSSCQM